MGLLPDKKQRILAEQLPPLSDHEAMVEANRCLYCYDAPCTHACPTHIDIPRFIKKISTCKPEWARHARFWNRDLLGATCARVCPVEELCEGACVLNAEHKPITIGRLQRYAMDHVYDRGIDVVRVAPATGRRVTVIGAGPAGLSCAGELARRSHAVTGVFEKRDLGGGLSTYGIIVLREPVPVALAEVEMIASGSAICHGGGNLGIGQRVRRRLCRHRPWPDTILGSRAKKLIWTFALIEQSKLDQGKRVGHNVVIRSGQRIDCATVAMRKDRGDNGLSPDRT